MSDTLMVERLKKCIDLLQGQEIRIMEVCGTHTQVIAKSGIRYLLSKEVLLLSGPGCPVCVTSESDIDMVIELLDLEDIILVTFGDMMKVKGTHFSLSDKKAQGSNIYVVYSPEDALTIAANNRNKLVVFIAVGFETTAPLIAVTVKQREARELDNLLFFTSLKRMEPIIRFILQDKRNKINGMICPGHVATITGADQFGFITDEFGLPAVLCGFENQDIATGICVLLEQITGQRPMEFINLYKRCVSWNGNTIAKNLINEVFEVADVDWRGIGMIEKSALVLGNKFEHLDVIKKLGLKKEQYSDSVYCFCNDIILGIKMPYQCKLFGSICTPKSPKGPCMVSSEGACATHFRYGGYEKYG
ncbi:MAG: hydrogenase formation protein HypD [Anaerolineaceae bacterium]|nr:MAG: hydrogenase formation protein HypD [Anaerolineaceae bacterium]